MYSTSKVLMILSLSLSLYIFITFRFHIAQPNILKEITSQSMGTNSVGLQIMPSKSSPSHYHVLTSTGGDDQSLTLSYAVLGVHRNESINESGLLCYQVSFDTAPVFTKQGAGGAALKGSLIVNLRQSSECERELVATVVTVAYDQRVSVWKVKRTMMQSLQEMMSSTAEMKTLVCQFHDQTIVKQPFPRLFSEMESMISAIACQWSFEWLYGVMTHVMEVSSLFVTSIDTEENSDTDSQKAFLMSIAGQGFQSFNLRL
jgi:hypothetical protein